MGYSLRVALVSGPAAGDGAINLERTFDELGGTVGRSARADWSLADPARLLSGIHCKFMFEAGQFYVVDLSTNGVYLNGSAQRLGKGSMQAIADGDHVRMGDFEFELQVFRDFVGSTTADVSMLLAGSRPLQQASNASQPELANATREMSAVSPPAGAGAAATGADGLADLLVAELGLSDHVLDAGARERLMRDVAAIVKETMQGMVTVLRGRSDVKAEFGAAQTELRPSQNNPLKYVESGNDALVKLLVQHAEGYLPAGEAVREGFSDLEMHQLALLAGMKAGLEQVARHFDPERFATETGSRSAPWKEASAAREQWQQFCDHYASATADDFEQLFRVYADAFAQAYDDVHKD